MVTARDDVVATHDEVGRANGDRRERGGPAGLIARHGMSAFFVLAFALSWLAWVPYVLSANGLGVLDFGFPRLLGTTQLLGVLPGAYLGPITAAFVVTAVGEGRAGLRRWTGRLLRWRVNWRWYFFILLGVPVVITAFSIPWSGGHILAPPMLLVAAYLPSLVLQMLTTGIAEEPGWRDFALPHLQPRFGPVRGTLILGPLWGMWHLPLFLTEWGGWPDVAWWRPLEFVLTCVPISIVMTWVFNRTGESLPLAMLLHTSINNFMSTAWSAMFPTIDAQHTSTTILLNASTAVAIVLLVITRGRLGYRGRVTPTRRR